MRKHGDAKKYNAHVIHVGHECDIAMVTKAAMQFGPSISRNVITLVLTICHVKLT